MSEESVSCKLCHGFYSPKQINYHLSKCGVCKYCNVVFEGPLHKKSHSCPGSLKICNICLKKFDLTKSRHAEKNYQRHKLANKCGECGKCRHVSKTNIDFITHKCGELSNRKRAFINAANADSGNVDASSERGHKIIKKSNILEDLNEADLLAPTDEDIDIIYKPVHPSLPQLIREHWFSVRTYYKPGPVETIFNFRLPKVADKEIESIIWNIFKNYNSGFKISASYGYALENTEDNSLRYWRSCINNAAVTSKPVSIHNTGDVKAFLQLLHDANPTEEFKRPSTKWRFLHLTNLTLYLLNQPNTVIQDNSSDNLCVFEAIYYSKNSIRRQKNHKREIASLARQFIDQNPSLFSDLGSEAVLKNFPGVKLDDLYLVERTFKIGVNVYQTIHHDILNRNTAVLIYRGAAIYPDKINVELTGGNHFKLIQNLNLFSKYFKCEKCGLEQNRHNNHKIHVQNCKSIQEVKYGIGYYVCNKNDLLNRLSRAGLTVKEGDLFSKYIAVYDFEVLLPKTGDEFPDQFTNIHEPLSVSIFSNVPGFEEVVCLVNENDNTFQLTERFLNYLNEISDKAFSLEKSRLHYLFNELAEKANTMKQNEFSENDEVEDNKPNNYEILLESLTVWARKLSILGFNSSNYDLNVIKGHLFSILTKKGSDESDMDNFESLATFEPLSNPRFHDNDDIDSYEKEAIAENRQQRSSSSSLKHVIRRGKSFISIITDKLVFLDISQYLAPGYSLSQYLQAFEIKDQKSYFCYEYMTDVSKLYEKRLPDYEHFFSKLKNKNVFELDCDEEAGREKYKQLQNLWEEKGFKNIKDLLIYYNNADVYGLLHAIIKQKDFFEKTLKLDLFKHGFTLPGLSLIHAFNSTDSKFRLIPKKHASFHKKVQKGVIGGPSLLFTRFSEVGVTKIRDHEIENPKTVKSIVGLDATSLYLWCFAQLMPTGDYRIRTKENQFQAEELANNQSDVGLQWIEYIETTSSPQVKLSHYGNGHEIKVGSRLVSVDAFCPKSQTCYEFHGCYYHCCPKCAKQKSEDIDLDTALHPYKNNMTYTQVYEATLEKKQYILNLGLKYVEIWECEWVALKLEKGMKKNDFSKYAKFPKKNSLPVKNITENDVIKAVKDGSLFGLVECSIRVPDDMKDSFKEFPPLFKHANISINDIGPFMRSFAENNNFLKKPRKALISSLKAENIILITPLLKWYIDNGLIVDSINFVMEFTPEKSFSKFMEQVTEARRMGDENKANAITSNLFKLEGNSAYGKIAMNKELWVRTNFCDIKGAFQHFQNPRFKSCENIGSGIYLIESSPRTIRWDLPLQISVFVYGYAKLKMLELVYDLIMKFIPRDSYELLYMDTDSMYVSYSEDSIENCVPVEKRESFYKIYKSFFPAKACDEHWDSYVESRIKNEKKSEPSSICVKCKKTLKFEGRTPGLFKTEFHGTQFIGLSSKCYYTYNERTDNKKFSIKGVQRNRNTIERSDYLEVLKTQKSKIFTNVGFRTIKNTGKMGTYCLDKTGLTYFYGKRIVSSDGVHTEPLSL